MEVFCNAHAYRYFEEASSTWKDECVPFLELYGKIYNLEEQKNKFEEILSSRHIGKKFQEQVPCYNYNKIYKDWWHLTLEGQTDICWPGKINYFALSSGTSEAASKYIPVTNDLLRGNKIIMIKQLISLFKYRDVPLSALGRGWLTLGGSTDLQKGAGYYAGDLSGITAKKAPFWFSLQRHELQFGHHHPRVLTNSVLL